MIAVSPTADKPSATCSLACCCFAFGNILQNGRSHPEAISHWIMGDVVAYGLIAALRDSGSTSDNQDTECAAWEDPKSKFHPNLQSFQYCTLPTDGQAGNGTFMSVFEPSLFQPLAHGSWVWREDVPGKPGAHVCTANLVVNPNGAAAGAQGHTQPP